MGSTAHGLPWPDPADPTRDGAAAIRSLAEAIDPRIPFKTFYSYGGYSTNITGDVSVATPGISSNIGLVATVESSGPFFITKYTSSNNGVVVFRVFSAADGGTPLVNGFIILSLYTWGN